MQSDIAALAYVGAAAVFAAIGAATWRRRANSRTIALSLTVVMAGSCWWALALALTQSSNRHLAAVATIATFPGPSVMVTAFACLGLAIVWPQWTPGRHLVALMLIEPVAISVAGVTNPWHQLVYRGTGADVMSDPAGWAYGPLFWLDTWYGYLCLAIGVGLIARGWWMAPPVFKSQRLALLLAALIPGIVNVIFLAGGFGGALDPTLFGFALTGTVMANVIFRQDLFEFAPVARTLIVDQIGDAIVVLSPTGRILDVNPAAAELLRGALPGAPAELIGGTVPDLFGPGVSVDRRSRHVTIDLAAGGRGDFQVRSSPLVDRRGRELGMVLVARNVTEAIAQTRRLSDANDQLVLQVETIERLRGDLVQLANRDPLTALHNRRYLVEHFAPMIEAARVAGERVAVVLIDIDRFKAINDQYGHLAGDAVLVAIAKRLREQAPAGALIARWGGEEFFIALAGRGADGGYEFAEELRLRCERQGISVAGTTVYCTLSAGVAVYPVSGSTMNDLFHAADLAMYEAKGAGRNVVRLHLDPSPLEIDARRG